MALNRHKDRPAIVSHFGCPAFNGLLDNGFGKARGRRLYYNTPTTDNTAQNLYLKAYNDSNAMKGKRMWSKLAIGTLFIGIILLGYNVLGGVLGLGYSDQVKFAPQSPIGFLGPERFEWINSLPNELFQKVALFIAQTPLYALVFGMSLLFFLIHFIVPDKN